MSGFAAVVGRDLRLVWRQPGDVVVVLAFFVMATVLFPLAIGPEPATLARIAPAALWVAALFSALLSLDRLFATDYADGSLDQFLLAPWPAELLAIAKCLAHWLTSGLPVTLAAIVVGPALALDGASLATLVIALVLGTPALSLLGGLGAALTLGARRGGALLALLVLPLAIPVLIFGTAAVEAAATGQPVTSHLGLLAALSLFALATTPWAIAAALRQAAE
jgi:heme exporter protein B